MWDFISDNWKAFSFLVGTVFSGGIAYQRQRGVNEKDASRLLALEEINQKKYKFCGQIMTKKKCDEKQLSCQDIQEVNHKHVSQGIEDIKTQLQMVLDHLLSQKG